MGSTGGRALWGTGCGCGCGGEGVETGDFLKEIVNLRSAAEINCVTFHKQRSPVTNSRRILGSL